MVPGMYHCQGGDVPDAFGQSPVSPAAAPDADHDIRRAIEAWVEQGSAPAQLIAGGAGQTRTLRPR
jgi:feruloyl esterase